MASGTGIRASLSRLGSFTRIALDLHLTCADTGRVTSGGRSFGPPVSIGLVIITWVAGCAASVVDVASPSAPSTSSRNCPALVPGSSNALADYFDMVVWQQRKYVASGSLPSGPAWSAKPALADRIGSVTCNVAEWSAQNGGLRVVPSPWPDGTATGLPVGTKLFALSSVEPRCGLGVRTKNVLRVYIATDLDSPDLNPACPT